MWAIALEQKKKKKGDRAFEGERRSRFIAIASGDKNGLGVGFHPTYWVVN
jgi:hypothetical protein